MIFPGDAAFRFPAAYMTSNACFSPPNPFFWYCAPYPVYPGRNPFCRPRALIPASRNEHTYALASAPTSRRSSIKREPSNLSQASSRSVFSRSVSGKGFDMEHVDGESFEENGKSKLKMSIGGESLSNSQNSLHKDSSGANRRRKYDRKSPCKDWGSRREVKQVFGKFPMQKAVARGPQPDSVEPTRLKENGYAPPKRNRRRPRNRDPEQDRWTEGLVDSRVVPSPDSSIFVTDSKSEGKVSTEKSPSKFFKALKKIFGR